MKSRIVKIGEVGVDSGQLIICDPAYIEGQYEVSTGEGDSGSNHDIYKHKETGKLWQFCYRDKPTLERVSSFPGNYADIIPEYGKCPNDLIATGEFEKTNFDPTPHIPEGEFSYRGICKATLGKNKSGQLNYSLGHAGVAVAFSSGFGDGTYDVFAEFIETENYGERIKKVWVELITEKDLERMDYLSGKK